jgi:hypothetical protein
MALHAAHTNLTQDLDNTGSYSVTANVPNIFTNALCVNVNRTELAPIVYETWPNTTLPTTSIDILRFWPWNAFGGEGQGYNNATVLDDVFGWRNQKDAKSNVVNETRPSKNSILKVLITKLTFPASLHEVPSAREYRKPRYRSLVC